MTFLYQPPSTLPSSLLLPLQPLHFSHSPFSSPSLSSTYSFEFSNMSKTYTTSSWFKLLLVVLLFESPRLVLSDDTPPDCPYPCLPPPSSLSGYYPPPPPSQGTPSFGYYPPPSGYVPYLAPPFVNLQAPPPPNPILPWFPFYYRSAPSPNSSPSLLSRHASTFMILLVVFPCFFLLLV